MHSEQNTKRTMKNQNLVSVSDVQGVVHCEFLTEKQTINPAF